MHCAGDHHVPIVENQRTVAQNAYERYRQFLFAYLPTQTLWQNVLGVVAVTAFVAAVTVAVVTVAVSLLFDDDDDILSDDKYYDTK